eukprot:CAMPEP_0172184914 /NCGR_PEP_ID=MMETSP1050-20130122/19857_1 /TAXON_ID=233186 /ORGANISM="Cryptomonas curvata, Strain CCAP979/52" /LENGTH=75 /DNA_ID=CAMNT_0012858799 /DNA_START=26 /DNA_END=249 /DNA_ORIENTATION=-
MGAGGTADLPVARGSWGGKLERAVAQQHGPRLKRLGRRRCETPAGPSVSFLAVLDFSMEMMLLETAHVWNTPGKG